ncbi:MAG: hypothetical protein ACI87E_000148 [Mariniblastus sp.]|jgi:hypothetical protein
MAPDPFFVSVGSATGKRPGFVFNVLVATKIFRYQLIACVGENFRSTIPLLEQYLVQR